MSIDLIKLLVLLYGLCTYGRPDDWDIATQVRLTLTYPSLTGSIELVVDPIPIYYRHLDYYCGLFNGVIIVDPNYRDKGCENVLQHEINHAWQMRTWGLMFPVLYSINPNYWEGPPQPAPRSLNWSLIRIWIPIDPHRKDW
jgi:hypothetical protein